MIWLASTGGEGPDPDPIEALLARPAYPPGVPSDHLLLRYAVGELSAAERAEVERALGTGDVQQRLARVRRELDAAEPKLPPLAAIQARAAQLDEADLPAPPQPAPWWVRWTEALKMSEGGRRVWSPLAGLLALGLLVLLVPRPPFAPGDGVRTKGDAELTAFTVVAGEMNLLDDGAPLGAGDRLGLSVTVLGPSALAVLGVDGSGAVSRYLPEFGDEPVPIEPSWGGVLPFSLTLDDAPGPEIFVALVTAPGEDLSVAEAELWLEELVRALGPEALAAQIEGLPGPPLDGGGEASVAAAIIDKELDRP